MSKIVLVNPNHRWSTGPHRSGYAREDEMKLRKIVPPLGLAYLASYIRNEHDVTLIDANALDLDVNHVASVVQNEDPDIVGVTAFWTTRNVVLEFAKMVPDNVLKVVGGSDPSADPSIYVDAYDIVIVGEGENTFTQMVNEPDMPLSKIHGLYFKSNGKIIQTPPRPLIPNLDDLPWPAWDMLPIGKYKPETMSIKYKPNNIMMMTSRGCPYKCDFCASNVVFKIVRERSVPNVIEEIKYLYDKFKVRSVLFMDSTFTANRNRIMGLCNTLIKEDIDIVWSCETRADRVDKELLERMHEAGCYFINYGVQTYSENVLVSIKRPLFFEQVKNAVKMTQNSGILARLDYILGLPGETKESMRDIVNKTIEIDPDFVVYYALLLLPSTRLYEQGYTIPFSDEELLEIVNDGYKKFYLRGGYIKRKLRDIIHPVYLKRYLECGMAFLLGSKKL